MLPLERVSFFTFNFTFFGAQLPVADCVSTVPEKIKVKKSNTKNILRFIAINLSNKPDKPPAFCKFYQ